MSAGSAGSATAVGTAGLAGGAGAGGAAGAPPNSMNAGSAAPAEPMQRCPFERAAAPPASSCGELDGQRAPGSTLRVRFNHLGYDSALPKRAVVEGDGTLRRFQVIDAAGASVYCGDLVPVEFSAWGGGPRYYTVAFDALRTEGSYRLQVDGTRTEPFAVAPDLLFARTVPRVLAYFRSARADDADVWAKDERVPFEGGSETRDVRGGWYDASGDISKYLSHLSYANFVNPQQIPLVAWALALLHDERERLLAAGGLSAAVQGEALWGADYLHRALDPAGFFYTGVFDGWSGDVDARTICAFEGEGGARTRQYQAAFREGGGMAIAALARIARWGVAGAFSAQQYLAAAERAFAHLQQHGAEYCDDGVQNVIDDYAALLAAAELYGATRSAAYLTAARERARALAARLHPAGYFIADAGARPFWHASDAGLPVVALARYAQLETEAEPRASALAAIEKHLQYLLGVTAEVANPFGYARQHVNTGGAVRSSFFIPHDNETGYWWQGENARLASLAAAVAIGAAALCSDGAVAGALPPAPARFAVDQLDWVLGKNPFDISFMAGVGRNNPPAYSAAKPQQGHVEGGIANGITGREQDGSGIRWLGDDAQDSWTHWRWVEQWLPHAAWYLVAVTALAPAD